MADYNGHKNRSYWNVSLWLHNDEGLYRWMRSCIEGTRTKDSAAEVLYSRLPGSTQDKVRYTRKNVRAALRG